MIEIKVQLQGCPRLSISADAEGLSDFLSSVRYVANRQDDVMYTSEEWHGELSASSVTDTEGRLCERFDLFPDARAAEDFSRVICTDEGQGGLFGRHCCIERLVSPFCTGNPAAYGQLRTRMQL